MVNGGIFWQKYTNGLKTQLWQPKKEFFSRDGWRSVTNLILKLLKKL